MSFDKFTKLTIIIVSEFNWCTLNLKETLLKFCLSLPKNFTLEDLTKKTLTTIENIYYLKNVKISRFRDFKGFDIFQNFEKIGDNKVFYTSILEAEDNRQTQITQFKTILNNYQQKSFQVLDLPDQMNLPSFSQLTSLQSTESTKLNPASPTSSTTSKLSQSQRKKARIAKAKAKNNKENSVIVSVPKNPNKLSKLKNKMSVPVNVESNLPERTKKAVHINKVQKK